MTMIHDRHADTWMIRGARPAWLVATTEDSPDEWPRVAAFEYARNELNLLRQQLETVGNPTPSPVARVRFLGVLRNVLASNSVFPSVSFDSDGALIAEWQAGTRRIEIEVSAEGKANFTIRTRGRRPTYQGSSETQLRRHLRDMSATVSSQNPRWRSLFIARHRAGQGAA